jgi:hypothetical protein
MQNSQFMIKNSSKNDKSSSRYKKLRFVTQYDHALQKLVLRTIDNNVKPIIDMSYK